MTRGFEMDQQVIISGVKYLYPDDREEDGQPFTKDGYGVFVWDGVYLGERLFASPGSRGYVEQWLVSNGWKGRVDGTYRRHLSQVTNQPQIEEEK